MSDTAQASPALDGAPDSPEVELPKMSFLDHLEELRKRLIVSIIAIGVAFFLIGGYLRCRVLLPGACAFFVGTGRQFNQMIKIDEYFGFASSIMLASGAIFEAPILIFFLARLGIVTPAFLLQKAKWAIVLSFIIAAILTPSPDMVNQTFLAVPMIALYFLGVGVAYVFGKKYD